MPKLPRWFWIAAFLVSLPTLVLGCATVDAPYCERYGYSVVELEGEQVVLIDAENVTKLVSLISGLSKGTCRLPPPKGSEV